MRKLAFILLVLLVASPALARGGGGCLVEGTKIATPRGEAAIESLTRGDEVTMPDGAVRGVIAAVTVVRADRWFEFTIAGRTIGMTGEHPVMVGAGVFRSAASLRAGDEVFISRDGRLSTERIEDCRTVDRPVSAYNLLVTPGGVYVAEGVIVHNKGCFLPDTPIRGPDGAETPISRLRVGDPVLSFTPDGRIVPSRVREILTHEADGYCVLVTPTRELRVTAEHPFYVGDGEFRTLEALRVGDLVGVYSPEGIAFERIDAIRKVAQRVTVFNLRTDSPNTYFAHGAAVHNKGGGGGGGCFVAGTPIVTPRGDVPIESLRPGDVVIAFDSRGRLTRSPVRSTFVRKVEESISLRVNGGAIVTTREHPVGVGGGRFVEAGSLREGDRVQRFDGERLRFASLERIELIAGTVLVYNLEADEPHTFIAGGLAVHNKGGFGGGYRIGRGYSSSEGKPWSEMTWWEKCMAILIPLLGISVCIFLLVAKAQSDHNNVGSDGDSAELDRVLPLRQVKAKAESTTALARYLTSQDACFDPDVIRETATSTFLMLQQCWQSREYGSMRPLLMPDLFVNHFKQIEAMKRRREINVISNLSVEAVRLVHIHFTTQPNERTFTVLVTASARDYYIHDQTRAFIRGDLTTMRFQEFWTFQQYEGRWLLRDIEQTAESSILRDENEVEGMSEQELAAVYGAPPAPRPVPQTGRIQVGVMSGRINRMEALLDSLRRKDSAWNRQRIKDRVRDVFLRVHLDRESCELRSATLADLTPGFADQLRAEIRAMQSGLRVEYRNLCVRRVEIVLIQNYRDNRRDSFIARVFAHAQRVDLREGQVVKSQPYVTAFVEYCHFVRNGAAWQLQRMMSPEEGYAATREAVVDEDQVMA